MLSHDTCKIWKKIGANVGNLDGRDGVEVNSPRAGGRYLIGWTASTTVDTLDPKGCARLTTWIVDQHNLGNDRPEVDTNVIKRAVTARNLAIFERRDRLIRYLSWMVEHLGEWVEYYSEQGNRNRYRKRIFLEMLAWTESIDNGEIYYFIDHLLVDGFVEASGDPPERVRLTPKGYSHLAKLDTTNVDSLQVFVAMWIDESTTKAYDEGIKKAIEDAGYRPIRIDREQHINKIDDEIIAAIRRSRFLVADFTCGVIEQGEKRIGIARGGVYYEAGFAQGLNIPVIWTCRNDVFDHVHFDTRQYNHIVWAETNDLYTQLKNRISALIGDGTLKEID